MNLGKIVKDFGVVETNSIITSFPQTTRLYVVEKMVRSIGC